MGNIADDFGVPSTAKLAIDVDDVAYAGFQLWQVRAGTIFDKILITDE
jgi:hypothetical protein